MIFSHQDLHVYLSEDSKLPDFNNPSQLVWHLTGLTFGDWYAGQNGDGTFNFDTELSVPEVVQNNGSYYLHAFLVRSGDSPIPTGSSGDDMTVHRVKQLNRFKKRKYSKTHNLLTGETEATDEEVLVL